MRFAPQSIVYLWDRGQYSSICTILIVEIQEHLTNEKLRTNSATARHRPHAVATCLAAAEA